VTPTEWSDVFDWSAALTVGLWFYAVAGALLSRIK